MKEFVQIEALDNVTLIKTRIGYMIKHGPCPTHVDKDLGVILERAREILDPPAAEEEALNIEDSEEKPYTKFERGQEQIIVELYLEQGYGAKEVHEDERFKKYPFRSIESKVRNLQRLKNWPHPLLTREKYIEEYKKRGIASAARSPITEEPESAGASNSEVSIEERLNQLPILRGSAKLFPSATAGVAILDWYAWHTEAGAAHKLTASKNNAAIIIDARRDDVSVSVHENKRTGRPLHRIEAPLTYLKPIIEGANEEHERKTSKET